MTFKQWTSIFPGRMGLSWKQAWDNFGTKEEAEVEAAKFCNAIAVPVQLFEHLKDCEIRMVKAERELLKEIDKNQKAIELLKRMKGAEARLGSRLSYHLYEFLGE